MQLDKYLEFIQEDSDYHIVAEPHLDKGQDIYNHYLEKGVEICNQKNSASERATCMKKVEIQGLHARLKYLRRAMDKCNDARYEERCRDKFRKKIKTTELLIKQRESELKQRLSK